MKSLKEQFLEGAHLFVMAVTMCIACTVFGASAQGGVGDGSQVVFSSYGYVGESMQYAMSAQHGDLGQHELQVRSTVDSVSECVKNSI